MKQEDVTRYIQRYVTGKASDTEIKMVDEWYDSFEAQPGLTDVLDEAEMASLMEEQFSSLLETLRIPSRTC